MDADSGCSGSHLFPDYICSNSAVLQSSSFTDSGSRPPYLPPILLILVCRHQPPRVPLLILTIPPPPPHPPQKKGASHVEEGPFAAGSCGRHPRSQADASPPQLNGGGRHHFSSAIFAL
mmetsp:Transcript_39107/g.83219  ORF Transcript_39107/g.83219 Transcript_39107/m.83219 type:complete len:119 (-) Transcript_39107:48-404(-)